MITRRVARLDPPACVRRIMCPRMCGFLITVNHGSQDDFAPALRTLASRGPDAEGIWSSRGATLGHRRLAIIDLSGGAQPMATPDDRYHIVYNGELYNFPDIRKKLEARGVAFRTRSDTEVLLHAVVAWGVDAIREFDGIFAFALWDSVERSLLVARDHLGVKPAYYATAGGGIVAASTIAPFLKLPAISKAVNHRSIRDYLAQSFISPPHTILRDVHALEPGCALRWSEKKPEAAIERYWSPPRALDRAMPIEELSQAAEAALRESVKRQLVADVELGVLFSGGIDSTLVTRYMLDAVGKPVKTFTVKFDQSAKHDEAPIAARIAREMGTDHHELHCSGFTEGDFQAAVASLDQPFGDSSYLPVKKLCELARGSVTVALGGDGGDEVFGGYTRYLRGEADYPDHAFWRAIRAAVERRLLPASLFRASLRGRDRVLRHCSSMADYPVTSRSIAAILSHEGRRQLEPAGALAEFTAAVLRWNDTFDSDSIMRADLDYFLSSNCLFKTDRASMSHGLEVRVPMLGRPVLDLMLPQPASVKLSRGLKSVLMPLARKSLPRESWDRPKRGFTVPVDQYLFVNWRGVCERLLADCHRIAPFFDATALRRRWNTMSRGTRVDFPMYQVIVLLAWLDHQRIQP